MVAVVVLLVVVAANGCSQILKHFLAAKSAKDEIIKVTAVPLTLLFVYSPYTVWMMLYAYHPRHELVSVA